VRSRLKVSLVAQALPFGYLFKSKLDLVFNI